MNNFEQISATYGLNSTPSEQLQTALSNLAKCFNPEEIESFYPQFEKIAAEYGISEERIETFVEQLYAHPQFTNLVTLIVPSFYSVGGDRMQFEDIYDQMMCSLRDELE